MILINDHFQNFKQYNIPKAQLLIADIPYNLGNNAYASSPQWYIDGDNKNGESKLANKSFFDTDNDFRIPEFFHFCSKLIKPEPKECGTAGCMVVFCAFEQLFLLIDEAKKHNFTKYIPLTFYKNYSPQVLKANMKIVGNTEYALLFYRDKLPKFNNGGKMIFNSMPWIRDNITQKIHPCLPAGNKVFFNNQWKNIEDVKIGDINSYGSVIDTTVHFAEKIVEIEVDGLKTTATWNHPFLIKRNQDIVWINADQIKDGDFILTNNFVYNTLKPYKLNKSSIWEKNIKKQTKDILGMRKTKKGNYALNTVLFGKNLTGRFLWECKYIIKILTKKTIVLKTCNLLVPLNINGCTKVVSLKKMNGINLVRIAKNIRNVIKSIGIIHVGGLTEHYVKNVFVKNHSKQEKFLLQKVGSVRTINQKIKVYNLTIDNIPAFDTFVGVSHNTQKPINILKDLIRLFTDENDVVIDPCAGSGTTLIAAEMLQRKSFGFEIKKEFVKGFNDKLENNIQKELI